MAQYRGDALWEDGPHLSAAYSGAILGGTPPAHPARNRGNQRRSDSPSLEEIRRTDPGRSEYDCMKRYTSTILKTVMPSYRSSCLLYTSDAADDLLCVDLGGRRIIKKKKNKKKNI